LSLEDANIMALWPNLEAAGELDGLIVSPVQTPIGEPGIRCEAQERDW